MLFVVCRLGNNSIRNSEVMVVMGSLLDIVMVKRNGRGNYLKRREYNYKWININFCVVLKLFYVFII